MLYLRVFIFFILGISNLVYANNCDSSADKQATFTPERKAITGKWQAEIANPSKHIILSAGHVNRVTGTSGYNDQPLVIYKGKKHTIEAALTKIITNYMVEIGHKMHFSVERFVADTEDFREASLELAHYMKITNSIAFEIHTDSPTEGNHRATNYDGQTGIIPANNGTITEAEYCVGNYLGKFKKGVRNLFVPDLGISIFELFPTNKAITMALLSGVKTGDYSKVKKISLPYINLFYHALQKSGI